MRVISDSGELRAVLTGWRGRKKTLGFVPTMGCLHEGHLSLIRAAKKENTAVIASIFVNPLQFGPREDFKRYPRNLERDKRFLKKEGTDFLFLPGVGEFYPKDFQTSVSVVYLSKGLCGKTRPTHFSGVCTVVLKLLNLVMPDRLYLGQKDYQQYRVLGQMMEDLGFPCQTRLCPIVREEDGLAMSSRNVLLSANERKEARLLHQALGLVQGLVISGVKSVIQIKKAGKEILAQSSLGRLDYLEVVNARTLSPVVKLKRGDEILAAVAFFFKKTRLIDNVLIKVT
jgi:pantoate--beta-alanine ligase